MLLLTIFALLATSVLVRADDNTFRFPEFSYLRHPLLTFDKFQASIPTPVIMHKYLYYTRGEMAVEGAVFTPGKASYNNYRSVTPFCRNLDSLYVPSGSIADVRKPRFLEVDLNGAARVFIVLRTTKLIDMKKIKSVQGLDSSWKNMLPVSSVSGADIPVGGSSRNNEQALPAIGIMLEKELERGETLVLPSPRSLTLNGVDKVAQYYLLFAQPRTRSLKPIVFPYPKPPPNVADIKTGKVTVPTAPVPNEECPSWLHDMYRAPRASEGNEKPETVYWHTWHPIVDPMYWCYFDHEHGSFPGNYRPAFDYTAFKTADPTTSDGRQEESDEGFKVFSLPLPGQKRFVIITVHMQGSSARRFITRFHTGIVAIFDKDWKKELEVFMKMDFGAGVASLNNNTLVPIDEASSVIFKKHRRVGQLRLRRFNVLNLSNYPSSVDKRFLIRDKMELTSRNRNIVELGLYEKWSAGLNTCSGSMRSNREATFTFDIRNIVTGKRFLKDANDAPMQILRGDSMDRKMEIGDVQKKLFIGIENCKFRNFQGSATGRGFERSRGVFFTDSYFTEVFKSTGQFKLKQFIKPGIKSVILEAGGYTPTSPWGGYYNTDRTDRGRFLNIENAVDKMRN